MYVTGGFCRQGPAFSDINMHEELGHQLKIPLTTRELISQFVPSNSKLFYSLSCLRVQALT